MSQPPPWDQGETPEQGQTPDQGQSANQGRLPSWPSGDQPSAWPSAGSGQDQPPSWPSGSQPPAWPSSGPGQGQPPAWPSGDQPPSWPSAGQPWPQPQSQPPSSWPSGGPRQDPPSAWPPSDQPPYPGPGYTYDYGPRRPRFRRRRPLRGALIVLGLFIVFSIVVRAITASHSTVSVTPFPSASGVLATGLLAPPGKVGSQFDLRDASGDTYRVTLVKVIDPARSADQFSSPASGKRFVGLVFKIKALTGSPKNEDADTDAVLVGDGQNYSADFEGIVGYTNFDTGTIHVAQGDTVTGSVTFQVPDGVTVSKVRWSALSGFGSTVEWNVHG
jgi:hypothetical protein